MKPILYESTETNFDPATRSYGLGVLSDSVRCFVVETLNGSFELEMDYPITGIHYSDIQCDRIILAQTKPRQEKAQAFRIYAISKPMNGIVAISARHLSYDLSHYVVQPKFKNDVTVDPVTAENVHDAITALRAMSFPVDQNGDPVCPFTLDSDIPLENTFSITKPASYRSFMGNEENGLAGVYGGEWSFDNYNCFLHNKRGEDNGVKIRYGVNLKDIKQEENIEDMYTAVYPFAIHNNASLTYVYRLNPDDPDDAAIAPDAPLVKAEGTFERQKVLPLDVSSNYAQYAADRISTDIDTSKSSTASGKPTRYQLFNAATVYMNDNDIGKPKINITLSFIDVAEFFGTGIFHDVDLGDTVHVYFEKLGIEKDSRCIKTTYNVLLDRYDKLELGDTASSLASTVASANNSASQASANATQARSEASAARTAASEAVDSARIAGIAAEEAVTQARSATQSAQTASQQAANAQASANSATISANNALSGLATLENVVDTVNWFAQHKTRSTDTTVVPGKTYYIYNEITGTLSVVEPEGTENPDQEGWYELSHVISNYIASHVAETDDGLSVIGLSNGWRILISSGAGNYAPGIFLIDPNGNLAQSSTAQGISFDSGKPFYIGDDNTYISFDGNGHITIGGSVTLGSNKTLSELLSELESSIAAVEYGKGTSPTSHADITSWSTTAPTWEAGKYIWMRTTTNGLRYTYTCIQGAQGAQGDDGEDATVLKIDSSRGVLFKSNNFSTILTVTLFRGPKTITNASQLLAEYGAGAFLQWYWRKYVDDNWSTMLVTDSHISDDGFTLTVTPEDVDEKIVFKCELEV